MSVEIAAELGQSHRGSLPAVARAIDLIAETGGNTLKLQCHHNQLGPRARYWEATGFAEGEWRQIAALTAAAGLDLLVSPFTVDAVALLDPLVERWKIGSAQVADQSILEAVAATQKPVLMSTGLASPAERRQGWNILPHAHEVWTVSAYPTPPEFIYFHGTYGFSDHSGTIWPSLGAVAHGAQYIEVHVQEARTGPDGPASIGWEDFALLVRGVRVLERCGLLDWRQTRLFVEQRRKYGLGAE